VGPHPDVVYQPEPLQKGFRTGRSNWWKDQEHWLGEILWHLVWLQVAVYSTDYWGCYGGRWRSESWKDYYNWRWHTVSEEGTNSSSTYTRRWICCATSYTEQKCVGRNCGRGEGSTIVIVVEEEHINNKEWRGKSVVEVKLDKYVFNSWWNTVHYESVHE